MVLAYIMQLLYIYIYICIIYIVIYYIYIYNANATLFAAIFHEKPISCDTLVDCRMLVLFISALHPEPAQRLTYPVSLLAMQELGCFQLPGIVRRSWQHGAVLDHAATGGDGGGFRTRSWASGSHLKMPSIRLPQNWCRLWL